MAQYGTQDEPTEAQRADSQRNSGNFDCPLKVQQATLQSRRTAREQYYQLKQRRNDYASFEHQGISRWETKAPADRLRLHNRSQDGSFKAGS